jgi:hypothetical protein
MHILKHGAEVGQSPWSAGHANFSKKGRALVCLEPIGEILQSGHRIGDTEEIGMGTRAVIV